MPKFVYGVNITTRSKIIRCAQRELERSGVEGFSIRATGAAAGLSAMAVYRHFKDRDDLLRAVGAEAFEAFYERVTAVKGYKWDRWIRAVTRAYVDFALDDPGRFDACFVMQLNTHRRYPVDFRAGKSPVIALMAERIATEYSPARERGSDPLEIALLIWSQLHGLTLLYRAGRFSLPRAAFLTLCGRATQRLLPRT